MNAARWEYLKALRPSKGVRVSKLGHMHDIGRNKAKREARAKGWRHIGKAPRMSGGAK